MAPPPVYPEGMGPPDGGYGWVVAAAYALNNIISIPILQNFGLVFRDLFAELNISGTDTAVIMNLNNAFGLALGLFNGPIMRRFTYRKVAICGALLVFVGMVLTAFARSFVEFLIFYGIIMSAGFQLAMSSFTYAINSYFQKRRGMAIGFAMTVTGLGPVFMPLLISLMMREFGARYTAMLLAALALHSLVAATLLQPVRWHLVKLVPAQEEGDGKAQELAPLKSAAGDEGGPKEDGNDAEQEEPAEPAAPMLRARRCSSASRKSGGPLSRATSVEADAGRGTLGASMWASMASIDDGALGGNLVAGSVDDDQRSQRNGKATNGVHGKELKGNGSAPGREKAAVDADPWWRSWPRAVVKFFDLGLLSDPIYLNMMLGLSFAVFAEINFSLLTPFILGDRHFDTQQIATIVSVIAVADIIFRFLAPFVKNWVKQPVRVMYMVGLAFLAGTRTVLIFCYSYESLLGVAAALGVAKGLRTVYWSLVIPDYVPIERLPAASGLQSVTNGLVFMALGPLMGVIRDKLGDYNYVIMACNFMTCITIVMWTVEFIIVAVLRRRRAACGVGVKA